MLNEENQDIDLANNEETVEETATEEVEEDTTDYKAESLKWKAIAQRNKEKSRTIIQKQNIPDEIAGKISKLELAENKRQFGYEHNLSPEETDAIFRVNPNPTKEDIESPFIKGGLEALRAKRRIESNAVSPSSTSPKFNGKEFKDLTSDEKKEAWPEFLKSKANTRR